MEKKVPNWFSPEDAKFTAELRGDAKTRFSLPAPS